MSDDSTKQLYKVSVEGPGVSIKRELPDVAAFDVIAIMMGRQPVGGVPGSRPSVQNSHAPAGSSAPGPTGSRPAYSLREFLDGADATKNPEKIVAIGAYLMDQGAEHFTRDDVKSKFKAVGEPAPANFSRDFALAITTGWLAEDNNSSGSFYITRTGRTAIEAGFNDTKIKGRRTRRKPNGKGDE